jgi:aromatic ring-cleaving dioxygenase
MPKTNSINEYQAHIYYSNVSLRTIARRIREEVESKFVVLMGRGRDEPLGPHPTPICQMAFINDVF